MRPRCRSPRATRRDAHDAAARKAGVDLPQEFDGEVSPEIDGDQPAEAVGEAPADVAGEQSPEISATLDRE